MPTAQNTKAAKYNPEKIKYKPGTPSWSNSIPPIIKLTIPASPVAPANNPWAVASKLGGARSPMRFKKTVPGEHKTRTINQIDPHCPGWIGHARDKEKANDLRCQDKPQ